MFGIYEDFVKEDFIKTLKLNCEKIQKYAKVENLFLTLIEMGYLDVPASTKYHCNFEGGLMYHSLNVLSELIVQTNIHCLEWQREESPIIVALFHDLCKLNFYKKKVISKWNSAIKKYEDIEEWVYENDKPYLGVHAESSVTMALKLINLTDEETACILWHMGCGDSSYLTNGYRSAYRSMPNILYTHIADSVATLKEDLGKL